VWHSGKFPAPTDLDLSASAPSARSHGRIGRLMEGAWTVQFPAFGCKTSVVLLRCLLGGGMPYEPIPLGYTPLPCVTPFLDPTQPRESKPMPTSFIGFPRPESLRRAGWHHRSSGRLAEAGRAARAILLFINLPGHEWAGGGIHLEPGSSTEGDWQYPKGKPGENSSLGRNDLAKLISRLTAGSGFPDLSPPAGCTLLQPLGTGGSFCIFTEHF